MQCLEVSCAVRPLYGSLGVKELTEFYVNGSMHRWSILIIVQPDATQSSLFIIPQVHSTCFGCQSHPSSGVRKTVTTASGTGHNFIQLPPSSVAKLAWPHWREVAAKKYGLSRIFLQSAGCSLQPGHYSSLTAPNLQPTANLGRNDQCGNQHHSRELLMMGTVMPETCWALQEVQ